LSNCRHSPHVATSTISLISLFRYVDDTTYNCRKCEKLTFETIIPVLIYKLLRKFKPKYDEKFGHCSFSFTNVATLIKTLDTAGLELMFYQENVSDERVVNDRIVHPAFNTIRGKIKIEATSGRTNWKTKKQRNLMVLPSSLRVSFALFRPIFLRNEIRNHFINKMRVPKCVSVVDFYI
jgi:hypothetical protein